MEVRWRLFARDVLSLLPDDSGEFRFGRPSRPVRGLRLLGIVVHRARADSSRLRSAGSGSSGGKKRARGGSGYGGGGERDNDDSAMDGEFGLLGIGKWGWICSQSMYIVPRVHTAASELPRRTRCVFRSLTRITAALLLYAVSHSTLVVSANSRAHTCCIFSKRGCHISQNIPGIQN